MTAGLSVMDHKAHQTRREVEPTSPLDGSRSLNRILTRSTAKQVFPNTHNFASLWLAANRREPLGLFLPIAVIFAAYMMYC